MLALNYLIKIISETDDSQGVQQPRPSEPDIEMTIVPDVPTSKSPLITTVDSLPTVKVAPPCMPTLPVIVTVVPSGIESVAPDNTVTSPMIVTLLNDTVPCVMVIDTLIM